MSLYEQLVSMTSKGTPNYSLYGVPAMWVLNMAPHFIAAFGLSGGKFTNAAPRDFHASVAHKANKDETDKRFLRAEAAQLNGFENIGWFAAAVVAANVAKIPAHEANMLTGAYLALRVVYTFLYIASSSETLSYLRSATYVGSVSILFRFFFRSAQLLQ